MERSRLKNIELFDLYVGKIFAKLYESFPLKTEVNPCVMINMEVNPHTMDIPKECEIFRDTMYWLEESGYIKYTSNQTVHYFNGAVLTAKGLELLKSVPPSVKSTAGIGENLTHWAKEGSDELLKGSVNTLLSMGVKMFG